MSIKSLIIKGISTTLFLLVVAISLAIQVQANGNFTFQSQKFSGANPISGTELTFTASPTIELYTNRSTRVRLNWTQEGNELYHVVYLSGATPVPFTSSAIPSPIDITDWNGLADGSYTIYISGVNNVKRSVEGTLILDSVAPNQATSLSLAVGGVAVTGPGSSRTLTLSWTAATDVVPTGVSARNASKYEVSYNHSAITETFLSREVTGTSFVVELPSSIPDTTVTFAVYSIDGAGNKNTLANATNQIAYVLNTTAPTAPSNLVLKNVNGDTLTGNTGGRFGDLSFTAASSADVASYEVAYRVGSNPFVILSSGSNAITYSNLFATGFDPAQGSSITLRVVAVDSAGNRSSELTRTIVYDSLAPAFVIQYLNTVPTPAVFASASGIVINQTNIKTLVVTNALNDIVSYVVERNNVQIQSATGTSTELQAYLRGLTLNGDYRVLVRDAAFNRSTFNLDVKVEGPRMPANRNVIVNGNDIRDEAGIQATISVDFDPSPDVVLGQSGTYRLFVDGRLISGTTPTGVGGRIRIEFVNLTAFYGDLQSIYVVQAVDQFGNTANYTNRTDTVIRDRMRPEARVLDVVSTDTTITATIELLDNNRVLTLAGARAELYNGTTLVTSIPLTVGRSAYTFSNLRDRQTNYNIRIIGSYTWDGATVNNAVLNEGTRFAIDTLQASPGVTASIQTIVSTDSTIKFTVQSEKTVSVARFIDVTLYAGTGPYTGNAVKTERIELPQTQVSRLSDVTFTGLNSGVNYHIQVREGGFILAAARTITNLAVPTSTFEVFDTKQDEITATIDIKNTNSATVFVFQGTTLMSQEGIALVAGVNRVVLPNLVANTTYNVKVIATYTVYTETPNGSVITNTVNGAVIGDDTFTTAKQMLTGSFPIVDVLDDEVLFTVVLEDPNNALVRGFVALYLGQILVEETRIDRGTNALKFENLQSNSDYTLSIHITYDLKDGKGEVTQTGYLEPSALSRTFVIRRFKTIKTLPDVEITNVSRTDQTLSISIQPIDPDSAFITGTVRIFSLTESPPLIKSETLLRAPFNRESLQTITFTGLQQNTVYRVEIDLDYNLEDGRNVRVYKPHNQEYRTRQSISADILSVDTTSTSIRVSIELFDYSSATVLAKIFDGSNQLGSAVQLENGSNNIRFENLEPNKAYRLVFDYNNGAQLLVSRDVQTRIAVILATPVPTLIPPTVTDNKAVIQIALTDVDNTVSPNVEIDICDDNSDECTKEVRTVSQVLAGTQIDLPYEEQTVTLRLTFTTNAAPQTIELPTSISLRTPVIPTIPQPIEPSNANPGVVIAAVIGTLAVGFVGVFVYSFRRLYIR